MIFYIDTGNARRQKYNTGSADGRRIRYFALTDDECFYHSFKRLLFFRFKTLLPFLKIFFLQRFYIYASAGTSYGPVSVCLCLFVCHKWEFYRNGWTNRAGFGVRASFHLSYTVLRGNSGICKNKGTSLWNFVLNSGLRKFRHGLSIVETCYRLSSWKVDAQSVINWTVVDQLSWQYLRAPTLVY